MQTRYTLQRNTASIMNDVICLYAVGWQLPYLVLKLQLSDTKEVDITFYVNGYLLDDDSILWIHYGANITTNKHVDEWNEDDPNLDCVFFRWRGGSTFNMFTGNCTRLPGHVICQTRGKNSD